MELDLTEVVDQVARQQYIDTQERLPAEHPLRRKSWEERDPAFRHIWKEQMLGVVAQAVQAILPQVASRVRGMSLDAEQARASVQVGRSVDWGNGWDAAVEHAARQIEAGQ